ncbi:hypothetical protein XM38_045310 [Halomicronema hongdechloris C2206]|uniref:Low-complexity protein n=1 Tax=Halomicronema hongdechloris C2206 TaxID=1641165 RepID=A0A1Z3HTH8_9CYAN|nr:helix-hairpin-helix domain-containing protein [Halomicronema hongdechloris]ASC73562.1 hypothetical protein XM38_045310 [Halomicronema hongdechloris C2206]
MRRLYRFIGILGGILVLASCVLVRPVLAASAAGELPPLTLELLQQRLEAPLQRDGRSVIDLRRFTIDLRADNGDFANRFYRLLQQPLQRGSKVLGLDLSHSHILGDLDLQQLGLREPLYGEALFPLLTAEEQAQLKRDRTRLNRLTQLSRSLLIQDQSTAQQIFIFRGPLLLVQTHVTGRVNATDTFFLRRVSAQGATFEQAFYGTDARFSQEVRFTSARFLEEARFRNSLFFDQVRFDQAQFQGIVNFQGVSFKASSRFNQASFADEANFSRINWQENADFAQSLWQGTASFLKDTFTQALFLTEARFEGPLILRQARFSQPVNLRGAMLNNQADFGDATFLKGVYINVAGLEFNAEQAEILGSPGQIGQVLSVPSLSGNETLLRNLVRNFRQLEQISDANQIEFMAEQLRLRAWHKQLVGLNINTASSRQLQEVGFSSSQADAILDQRQQQPFLSATDLLSLESVDLAAYLKVRDRILTSKPLSWSNRVQLGLGWLWLGMLILLSHYGTSVGLTLGGGLVAIAFFALMFWLLDRYRRRLPQPILPPLEETGWMLGSFALLVLAGLSTILRLGQQPGLALLCLAGLTLPVPLGLLTIIYRRGRYHDDMDISYFVEDGGMRQLRLLIARLPIMPKFAFFRDRYTPILLDRRWNWLNYYDFSLNNWLRFGFNDIRMRDRHMPGLITALVWYQWTLGLFYVALLLWTLSRTIPGLNLLLYF